MIRIERYSEKKRGEWDDFVSRSRNATFLFNRGFMDYHSDRFADHSLMFYLNQRLIALLPADLTEDEEGRILHSHRGLTYGGLLLLPKHCMAEDVMEIFDALCDYCRHNNIGSLDYKPMPYIYCSAPSGEDIYALWRHGATMSECNLSVTIDYEHNPGFDTRQRRNVRRGIKSGSIVRRISSEKEILEFHRLLSDCLAERHDTLPVHSVEELLLLHSRFLSCIEFYGAYSAEGDIEAGLCIFNCGVTAHAQYICSSAKAREDGMLALLMEDVIERYRESGARYFDFGICNEDGGRYLNVGLAAQKYGLGGTGVSYTRYRLTFV